MNTFFYELIDKIKVILEGVFVLLGTSNISAVANNCFDDATSLLGSVNTKL